MIHRVRLYHSTDGSDGYHSWLDTLLTNLEPWASDEVSNDLPTEKEPLESEYDPYYQGELAFEWTEDRSHILDNLDSYAASYCNWHRIGYHECTHDSDGGPCSWDEQRESGSIPTYIESMEPE